MSDTKFKPIEQITETELQELWPLIGGAPHLFAQGKDELKEGLSKGFFESLQMDYYTMAAIVDYLRSKGYEAGLPTLPSESGGMSAVWVKASDGLPSEKDGITKLKIDSYENEGVWSEKDKAFIVGGCRFPPTLYYIEWLNESPSLSPDQSGKEEAFGEWLLTQNYKPYAGRWYLNGNHFANQPCSTKELYDIFKPKNKQQ